MATDSARPMQIGMDMPIKISIGGTNTRKERFSVTLPPQDAQNCIPWGILVVSQNLEIIFSNARARIMLQQQDGLCAINGRLCAERSTTQRKLETMAAAFMSKSQTSGLVGIPGKEGIQRYAIRMMPCELPEVFGKDSFLVVVSDLTDNARASRTTISNIFSLSEREAEFAEHFSGGLRVAIIAQKMGVAVNTARVHLRHVLAKTGANSQIDLARIFARLP